MSEQRVTTTWHEHGGKRVLVVAIQSEKITDFDIPVLESEFKAILPTCGYRLAVDMSSVQLLGSSGLAFLIWLKKQCAAYKDGKGTPGKVVFFSFSDEIMGMLKVTRLHTMLEIAEGKKEAVGVV